MASTEHAEHFTRVTLVSILISKIAIQSQPNTEQKLSRMAMELSIFNAVSISKKMDFVLDGRKMQEFRRYAYLDSAIFQPP